MPALQRAHPMDASEPTLGSPAASSMRPDDIASATLNRASAPGISLAAPVAAARLAPELVMLHQPFSAVADGLRSLRSHLARQTAREPGRWRRAPPRAWLLASAERGVGKSFVAANLAIAWAQTGARTLLIDAQWTDPVQDRWFRLSPGPGWRQLLEEEPMASPDDDVAEQPTLRNWAGTPATVLAGLQRVRALPGLTVMTAGRHASPSAWSDGPRLETLLLTLRRQFDQVIVDGPALDQGTQSLHLADACGAALVVARRDHSRLKDLAGLSQALRDGGETWAGLVVNEF